MLNDLIHFYKPLLKEDDFPVCDAYLTYIDPLVPLVYKLDCQCPVLTTGSMSHCKPFILCKCVWSCAQNMPVPQPNPGYLKQNMSFRTLMHYGNPKLATNTFTKLGIIYFDGHRKPIIKQY